MQPVLQAQDLVLHLAADQGIERRERLVEDQHLRVDGEGAREADALLHPPAQLVRIRPLDRREPDDAEQLSSPLMTGGLVDPLHLEPVGDVVDHRPVREEAEVLEHHRDLRAADLAQLLRVGAEDVLAADGDRARGRLDQPRDAADERRLAAPREAHDHEHLAAAGRRTRCLSRRPCNRSSPSAQLSAGLRRCCRSPCRRAGRTPSRRRGTTPGRRRRCPAPLERRTSAGDVTGPSSPVTLSQVHASDRISHRPRSESRAQTSALSFG